MLKKIKPLRIEYLKTCYSDAEKTAGGIGERISQSHYEHLHLLWVTGIYYTGFIV